MMQGPTFPGLLDTRLARHTACVRVPAGPPDGGVQAPGALLGRQMILNVDILHVMRDIMHGKLFPGHREGSHNLILFRC